MGGNNSGYLMITELLISLRNPNRGSGSFDAEWIDRPMWTSECEFACASEQGETNSTKNCVAFEMTGCRALGNDTAPAGGPARPPSPSCFGFCTAIYWVDGIDYTALGPVETALSDYHTAGE